MTDYDVRAGVSPATGWPTIEDAAAFVSASVADPNLLVALNKAVSYGQVVLGDRYSGIISDVIFAACLDYTGSAFTERIGQEDIVIEGLQGSVSLSRYRRTLLSSRFVAIA